MENERVLKENWKEYPAVFEKDGEDEGWISVTFPDIIPGVTCGKGMEAAYKMAEDLLALMLDDAPQQCFPPSTIEKLWKEYPKALDIKMVYPRYHPLEEWDD